MQCKNFIDVCQVRFVNITMRIIEQVTKSGYRAPNTTHRQRELPAESLSGDATSG
jgi:hypothetical protein